MRVIDFRVRPPVAGFEKGRMYTKPERTAEMAAAFGFPDHFPAAKNFEADFAASGIELGIMPGRVGAPDVGPVENEALLAYARSHAGRLAVFPALDPTSPGWKQEADHFLAAGIMGFTLEPGLLQKPLYPDDPACSPVYELCAARGLPLILSAGGNVGPDCSYMMPVYFDRVARDFPKLNLVIAHGGYPWITETNHVAFRRGNVYVSPDMYFFMAGNEGYRAAMNGFLSERYVYASSYPFVPLKGYLEQFLKSTANEKVAERVLHANAARLLGLK